MRITTNPPKMIMSAYHTIKKMGHNIVLKEIQHLTGMTHCGSGSRGTVNCFTPPAILNLFLQSVNNIEYEKYIL
jgi:hypothetical protein